jgi:hypothetical protein
MTFLDIILLPCFRAVTPCKLQHHSIVIRSVITSYMTNLNSHSQPRDDDDNDQLRVYLVNDTEPVAYFVESLPKTPAIVRRIHLRESK